MQNIRHGEQQWEMERERGRERERERERDKVEMRDGRRLALNVE